MRFNVFEFKFVGELEMATHKPKHITNPVGANNVRPFVETLLFMTGEHNSSLRSLDGVINNSINPNFPKINRLM